MRPTLAVGNFSYPRALARAAAGARPIAVRPIAIRQIAVRPIAVTVAGTRAFPTSAPCAPQRRRRPHRRRRPPLTLRVRPTDRRCLSGGAFCRQVTKRGFLPPNHRCVPTDACSPMRAAMAGRRAGIRLGGRGGLRVLNAKSGFALDRLQTIFKGRKIAIRRTAGEVRAPLTVLLAVLLIALRPRSVAEGAPNNEDHPDRNRQCPCHGQPAAVGVPTANLSSDIISSAIASPAVWRSWLRCAAPRRARAASRPIAGRGSLIIDIRERLTLSVAHDDTSSGGSPDFAIGQSRRGGSWLRVNFACRARGRRSLAPPLVQRGHCA